MKTEWIGVDLDGTLAYDDGLEHDPGYIGEPIFMMVNNVKQWISEGKTVKIFTSRVDGHRNKKLEKKAIKEWCRVNIGSELKVTCKKDHNCIAIYDNIAHSVAFNKGSIQL